MPGMGTANDVGRLGAGQKHRRHVGQSIELLELIAESLAADAVQIDVAQNQIGVNPRGQVGGREIVGGMWQA